MNEEMYGLKIYYSRLISGLIKECELNAHLYDIVIIENYMIVFYMRLKNKSVCIAVDYDLKLNMTIELFKRIKEMYYKED